MTGAEHYDAADNLVQAADEQLIGTGIRGAVRRLDLLLRALVHAHLANAAAIQHTPPARAESRSWKDRHSYGQTEDQP